MNAIFVYVAHNGGKADDSVLELASAARAMFPGSKPVAIVTGSGIDGVCQEAAASFGEVWKFDNASLAYPNAELLRPLLVKTLPAGAMLLLPHNTFGLDLGPGLSIKLNAPARSALLEPQRSPATSSIAPRMQKDSLRVAPSWNSCRPKRATSTSRAKTCSCLSAAASATKKTSHSSKS